MARMLVFVVLCVAVSGHPRSQHVKFPKSDDSTGFRKVACSGANARERESIIEQSKCGAPKEVFVYLDPKSAHEQVSPGAVWVKRCVGLCEYDNEGSCVPTATVTRHIPIRIFNAKTNKETCATYPVEEHVSCGCCAHTPEGCAPPRVYNPRKCSCQCPNMEERRQCLKKRSQNMKWSRSRCQCEVRRKVF